MRRTGAIAATLCIIGACVSSTFGQSIIDTSSASNVYIGIKGGFVLSSVWGPSRPEEGTLVESVVYSMLPNVTAGVNVPIVLRDHFIVEPELLFTTKGTKWLDTTDTFSEVEKDIYRRSYCLDALVLAKLMVLKPEKRFRPAIYAGPQVSWNILTYTTKEGENQSSFSENRWSVNDSTLAVDVSALAGLALHIRAGRGFFIIDARGVLGLLNVGNGEGSGVFPAIIRNAYGAASVAYCFNPKRRKSLW